MRQTGTLTEWDPRAGFGVVTVDETGEEIFVQASDGLDGAPPPLLGELLSFDRVQSATGARRAVDITRLTRGTAGEKMGATASGAGLALAPVEAPPPRAPGATAATPRPALARPPRRVRAPWSLGRMLATVLALAVAVVLIYKYHGALRDLDVDSLSPDQVLPSIPKTIPRTGEAAPPREPLTQ